MDITTFRELPLAEITRLVRLAGLKVCVFPINGTRRWFLLEHPATRLEDSAYCNVTGKRQIELYQLLFNHGIETLLTPIFGPDLLGRGEAYTQMAMEGLARLATHPDFLAFYREYQVRVRFYGDHREFFHSTADAYLADLFDDVTRRTKPHDRYRLFFGVCAHDATDTIARLVIQYHSQHGCVPDKRSLVEMYYGEYVEPADLFIGFDKFCVFDMPLVATGNTDLYFTVGPSPYLSERQLRDILYDHIYNRRGGEPDYAAMEPDGWSWMRSFYAANLDRTQGVGMKHGRTWYPSPQVELPASTTQQTASSK